MTRRPITIGGDATVNHAAELLRTCRIRHLPVVDGAALIGIISLRDVVTAPPTAKVADVMTAAPEVIGPERPLASACKRMLTGHHSSLPVLDRDQLVGIFTATDGLRGAVAALEQEPGGGPTVALLMTPRPLETVCPELGLAAAWQRMVEAGVRHLPVLADARLIGLLSDRDVLQASAGWLDLAATECERPPLQVRDAMSARLATTTAEAPAVAAARTLLRRRTGALAVLRGGRLVGMLTVSDFLYWIRSRT